MSSNKISYSIEVFPTKTSNDSSRFWDTIKRFDKLNPTFYSVTANSNSQIKGQTKDIVLQLKKATNKQVAAHMVFGKSTEEEIKELTKNYWNLGIKHIVAIRGDEVDKNAKNRHAIDLIKIIKKIENFEISVAGYPEKHPDAIDFKTDIINLKSKVDCGASRVITQFFFDPDIFLRFRDKAVRAGVDVPIIPGLLPIVNFSKLKLFAKRCQANVPEFLVKLFADIESNSIEHKLLAMNIFTHQITKLIENGVKEFHFYSLNEILLTYQVCRWIEIAF